VQTPSASKEIMIRLSWEAYEALQRLRNGRRGGVSKMVEGWLWKEVGERKAVQRLTTAENPQVA
jgi:hypothetical protein